jgi:hypothetical protein
MRSVPTCGIIGAFMTNLAREIPQPIPTNDRERRRTALLSFLLPGMGQVYQGHYRRGVALFAAFSLLASITEARLLLPFAAVLAAAEAYRGRTIRLPKMSFEMPFRVASLLRREQTSPYRPWLYGIVASLGFCLWIGLVIPFLYPYSVQATLNDQVDALADRVRGYVAEQGKYPAQLSEVLPRGAKVQDWLVDPWGTEYGFSATKDEFEIRSAGSDKKMGTSDDYVFHYR